MTERSTNHPRIVELATKRKELNVAIGKHREERAVLSAQFEGLENEVAAINEKLKAKRRQLDLNRKRGRELGDQLDAARDEERQLQTQIDAALGNVEVKVRADQIAPGVEAGTEVAGKARDLARKFDMTVQDVIVAAGGTIEWQGMKTTFPGSSS